MSCPTPEYSSKCPVLLLNIVQNSRGLPMDRTDEGTKYRPIGRLSKVWIFVFSNLNKLFKKSNWSFRWVRHNDIILSK